MDTYSYYLAHGENVLGPYSFTQIKGLYLAGSITLDYVYRQSTEDGWHDLGILIPELEKEKPISTPRASGTFQPGITSQDISDLKSSLFSKAQGFAIIFLLLVGAGAPMFIFLKPTPHWEYLTVNFLAETSSTSTLSTNLDALSFKSIPNPKEQLNLLGDKGWELVGTYLEIETSHPNFGKEDYVTGIQPNVRPQRLVCILKRQKN